MSQRRFRDPIVSTGPTRTGTGSGTLSVDRLTHFTTAQSYTFTCIAKSPSTIFSAVASLDGPVGLATVGQQFYDEDLKIFVTITQGSTPFEVGDHFDFSVVNGDDLNQDNIDDYDEEPQKNFGPGVKGTMSGDHSIRFADVDQKARAVTQALEVTALTVGASTLSFRVYDTQPAQNASVTVNGILFTATVAGAAGNAIQVEFIGDVTAGSEFVSVASGNVQIHCQSGVSTLAQVITALAASSAASAQVTFSAASPSDLALAPISATNLTGGVDAKGSLGSEVAELAGNEIRVYLASGLSSISSVVAAVTGSAPASALVSIKTLGDSSQPAYSMASAVNLLGGTGRQFALNKKELSDASNFVEGNADLAVNDVTASGHLKVGQDAEIEGPLSLTAPGSGLPVGDVQDYVNRLIQNQKIALRTTDGSKLTWVKPQLSFTSNIEIEFADTGVRNTVDLSSSPIALTDGQSAYVVLDRKQTRTVSVVVAANVPEGVNTLRLATRYGDNLILHDNTFIRDGKSVTIGEGGGAGGAFKVDLLDPIDTTLPTGASATIDGVTVTNGMQVLFTNLTAGNLRVYKVAGVGSSMVWTPQSVYSNGLDPINGDDILVVQGSAFARAYGIFDGTAFQFNDRVRYYNGTDYWEVSNLKQASLLNNTTDDVFAIAYAGSENMFVDYSVIRAGKKAAGTIILTTDGSTVAITSNGAEQIPLLGVTFDADIVGSQIRLRYTTTNTGHRRR